MSERAELIRRLRALADDLERADGHPPAPALERRPATAAAMAGGTREVVGVLKFVDDCATKSGKPMVRAKLTARENGQNIEERYVAFGDVCADVARMRGEPVRLFLKAWKDTFQIVSIAPSRGIAAEDVPF